MPPSPTAADLWALLSRWSATGEQAVKLIGETTTMLRKGRLPAEQAERLELLLKIDRLASDLYRGNPKEWLHRPNGNTVFEGGSPIAYMAREGKGGMEDVLRHLNRMKLGGDLAVRRR